MDPLTLIVAAMSAILFGWIGYFLGNAFPVTAKAKKQKEKRTQIKEITGQKNVFQHFIDWVLEREEEETEQPEIVELEPAITEETQETDPAQPTSEPVQPPPPQPVAAGKTVVIDTPKQAGEDPVVLWHNRRSKKLFAKLENDIIDLDIELNPSQHGALSMLLVDLQERVGLSATLRDALIEGTDKVMAEKERKQAIPPGEEPLEKPSFNPIKSFVNYVRSDIPKLDDNPLSIPEQIDQILQANLAGTHLENKGISVRDWPNRGVVFIIGLDIYEDLHKIPDAEIRDQIRRAVKEWEATQEDTE